jgi:hypothetical protein
MSAPCTIRDNEPEAVRKVFELCVRTTPGMLKQLPLEPVMIDGKFDGYFDAATDHVWAGFTLGMLCAHRLARPRKKTKKTLTKYGYLQSMAIVTKSS